MRSAQQRFWPDAQPLVERLGREFFLRIPPRPGVYLMHGSEEKVLYVGKAKSLRHRLSSYRVANPERMARRTLRLLHLVRAIRWEECADESSALRRESELLLELKPRFNRAGIWRGPQRHLLWRSADGLLETAVALEPREGWESIGVFGGHANYVHRALLRLIWCRLQPERGLAGLPSGWFRGLRQLSVSLPISDSAETSLIAALTALRDHRWETFVDWLLPPASRFEELCRQEDLSYLETKFSRRPREILV